jgi:hypothetical protein
MHGDLPTAIREVTNRHAERICAPGKWRVWRDGEKVKHEILKGDQ